jgi:glyoxylase-like metal-dependent hydrolase (beta-lactamase superfamily II)
MRRVADGVWQLWGVIPHLINAYLIQTPRGDVLIDAGIRWTAARLLRTLRKRKLAMVALTHVHPDHQGAAAAVCRQYGVPLACHVDDADVMEGKRPMEPNTTLVRLADRLWSGPPYPVDIRWKGGERLGEWQVIHAPGHTPGHVIFYRERDRTAIVGDVVRNLTLCGGLGRLAEPLHDFSVDPALNRRSLRLLADLRPALLCFGHGPPRREAGEVERLAKMLYRM